MDDIIKLSHGGVPDFGTGESVLSLDLRTKVAEHDDGGLIRAKEERTDEEIGGRERGGVAVEVMKEVNLR